ncbi:hypothetical protein GUJ93_ZPchr0005g14383 [Zizania palustris]|uniref:Metallothionein-like protein n=1 Tax=Zizania palustris TaxID=103762 RepID=A0A8J5SLR7_ZIZPA|nr:hypothetical protein GUJ93_ZPchr0005g14383 [Zizania palustris]
MSCCGGNCGCGSGCGCGNGCGGCKMFPDVEATATNNSSFVAAAHKGSAGGAEMSGENGGCGCSTCNFRNRSPLGVHPVLRGLPSTVVFLSGVCLGSQSVRRRPLVSPDLSRSRATVPSASSLAQGPRRAVFGPGPTLFQHRAGVGFSSVVGSLSASARDAGPPPASAHHVGHRRPAGSGSGVPGQPPASSNAAAGFLPFSPLGTVGRSSRRQPSSRPSGQDCPSALA